MIGRVRLIAVLLAITTLSFAAGVHALTAPSGRRPLTHLTVQLNWTHDAQFAGFYAAVHNGYYAAEGLDVRLVPGGLRVDAARAVADGTAQFGVDMAERLILQRAAGLRVRAIATIFRRSPIALFALASSHIARPADLIGKTINASPDTATTLHAMLARAGIRRGQYTEVALGPTYQRLFSGAVSAFAGFLTTGAVQLQWAGHRLTFIYPDDYGVHFYGSTIIATDAFITGHPDVARRFLRATLKGWTNVVENPATVGALVATYNPRANGALEVAKLTASLPLINTGEDRIGWMTPQAWAGMASVLRTQGLLTKPFDLTQIYTLQVLRGIDGNGGT